MNPDAEDDLSSASTLKQGNVTPRWKVSFQSLKEKSAMSFNTTVPNSERGVRNVVNIHSLTDEQNALLGRALSTIPQGKRRIFKLNLQNMADNIENGNKQLARAYARNVLRQLFPLWKVKLNQPLMNFQVRRLIMKLTTAYQIRELSASVSPPAELVQMAPDDDNNNETLSSVTSASIALATIAEDQVEVNSDLTISPRRHAETNRPRPSQAVIDQEEEESDEQNAPGSCERTGHRTLEE